MITALTELDSLERMDVKIMQQRVDLPNFRHVLNKLVYSLRDCLASCIGLFGDIDLPSNSQSHFIFPG
jgi:hypothetical protein